MRTKKLALEINYSLAGSLTRASIITWKDDNQTSF